MPAQPETKTSTTTPDPADSETESLFQQAEFSPERLAPSFPLEKIIPIGEINFSMIPFLEETTTPRSFPGKGQ